MYSQCTHCLTVYKLHANELATARGQVRCGTCAHEFDALATLVETLPEGAFERLPLRAPDLQPPLLSIPSLRPSAAQRELFTPPATPAAGPTRPPSFARLGRRAPPRPHRLRWAFACLLAALVLGGQYAWAERLRLLREPVVRDAAQQVCARLPMPCRLPLQRDVNQLLLLARDVRPHPSVRGALMIAATISNTAGFAQPFPTVEIALGDADEQRIAMRRFRPEQYVSDAEALARGMGPGTSTELHFEVADPGKRAVAFEFSFL